MVKRYTQRGQDWIKEFKHQSTTLADSSIGTFLINRFITSAVITIAMSVLTTKITIIAGSSRLIVGPKKKMPVAAGRKNSERCLMNAYLVDHLYHGPE